LLFNENFLEGEVLVVGDKDREQISEQVDEQVIEKNKTKFKEINFRKLQ